MPKKNTRHGVTGARPLVFLTVAALNGGAWAMPGPSLDFDRTFSDRQEPRSLHFTATYSTGGGGHRLEVWRSGAAQLRRQTDGVLDTYVIRNPRDAEYRMVVLDRQRKIATRIDRSNLYRIGNFTDWFDLSHGLRHPKGAYTLVSTSAPAGAIRPTAPCQWYALDTGSQHSETCWSQKYRLPLLIYSGTPAKLVWRLDPPQTGRIDPRIFTIDDTGYVENDANQDIEKD